MIFFCCRMYRPTATTDTACAFDNYVNPRCQEEKLQSLKQEQGTALKMKSNIPYFIQMFTLYWGVVGRQVFFYLSGDDMESVFLACPELMIRSDGFTPDRLQSILLREWKQVPIQKYLTEYVNALLMEYCYEETSMLVHDYPQQMRTKCMKAQAHGDRNQRKITVANIRLHCIYATLEACRRYRVDELGEESEELWCPTYRGQEPCFMTKQKPNILSQATLSMRVKFQVGKWRERTADGQLDEWTSQCDNFPRDGGFELKVTMVYGAADGDGVNIFYNDNFTCLCLLFAGY